MKQRNTNSRFRLLRWGWRLVLLAVLAGGWGLAAAALHVVIVPGQAEGAIAVLVIPKNRLGFAETYVDARGWSAADVQGHEALVSRLIEAGNSQHLAHALSPEQLRRLEEMLRIRRGAVRGDL